MELRTQLSQRAEQRLALMPKMLQSVELLQLATVDLLTRIDAEVQSNEALELVSQLAAEEAHHPEPPPEEHFDPDRLTRRVADDEDRKHQALNNAPASRRELLDDVREQLAWLPVSDDLAAAVLALAENLDERGLLDADGDGLGAIVGDVDVDEALAVLQSLEPRGLGAGSAVEAMLLQISATDPDRHAIELLLTTHLAALAAGRYVEVARSLGFSATELDLLIERVRALEPRPAASYEVAGAPTVRPDLLAFLVDGEPQVVLADGGLPLLELNPDYVAMAGDTAISAEVRRYVRDKVSSARELMWALAMRQDTLLAVGRAIIERQRDFLVHGPVATRPLRMAEIASEVGIHTSTVSRAVAEKYVQTDRGVYALRMFFDGARGAAAAAGVGRLGVRERIGELIAAEAGANPLTDDEIVSALANEDIRIARRTVAKYRRELGIQSSWRRREPSRRQ